MRELCSADVIVAGGGSAGFAAAVASARQGADTVLVEKNGIPGGVATSSMMMSIGNHLCTGDDRLVVRGIAEELIDRVAMAGGTDKKWKSHKHQHITYDIEVMVDVMIEMLKEAGAKTLLHTIVSDIITADSKIKALTAQHASGEYLLSGKTFVDATGDATLAYLAGETYTKKERVGSLLFKMCNVNMDALYEYFKNNPSEYPIKMDHDSTFEDFEKNWLERGVFHIPHGSGKVMVLIQDEIKKGNYSERIGNIFGLDYFGLFGLKKNSTCLINSLFFLVDDTDPWALSKIELESRSIIKYISDFIQKSIPGFKDAFVCSSASELGLRASRNIDMSYDFSVEEKGKNVKFDDVIGEGPAIQESELGGYGYEIRGKRKELRGQIKMPYAYEVPYRTIVPKKTKNLYVVSGKAISNTVLRQIALCMLLGQAGGVAASQISGSGIANSDIDIKKLQEDLLKQNVYLGENDRLKELGIDMKKTGV